MQLSGTQNVTSTYNWCAAHLAQLYPGTRASELVSSRSGPAMDLALPRLPAALLTHGSGAGSGGGVCLLGPTDVALALAGQHGKVGWRR